MGHECLLLYQQCGAIDQLPRHVVPRMKMTIGLLLGGTPTHAAGRDNAAIMQPTRQMLRRSFRSRRLT